MVDFNEQLKNLRQQIATITNSEVYLYGKSLRQLLNNNLSGSVNILVTEPDKHKQKNIQLICTDSSFNINFYTHINTAYSSEFYTLDQIFAKIPLNFDGSIFVESTNHGIGDFQKKIIKLTKTGKNELVNNPNFMLETIGLVSEYDYTLDAGTISLITNNKQVLTLIERRKVFFFLKNILKNKKPRKIISLLNTLGLSKELFNNILYETSYVNHLKIDDYYEFFAIIFSNTDQDNLEKTLLNSGFKTSDINEVNIILKALSFVDESDEKCSRLLLSMVNKTRVNNFIRLLSGMGYKSLTKKIRSEKATFFKNQKLCLDIDLLKVAFRISDNDANNLLDIAKKQVILDPSYNVQHKLLTFLNNHVSK